MKNFLPILLLFANSALFAQHKVNQDTAIACVRVMVETINGNLSQYKKVVKEDIDGESTEGIVIEEYFENGKIRKIAAEFYGETGKMEEEYFYDRNKLLFYFSKEVRYVVPMNVDSNVKIAPSIEKRYYFVDGNIVAVKLRPVKALTDGDMKNLSVATAKEATRLLKLK